MAEVLAESDSIVFSADDFEIIEIDVLINMPDIACDKCILCSLQLNLGGESMEHFSICGVFANWAEAR